MWEGIMSSAAGKFVTNASGMYEQQHDEFFSHMQGANLEPQELMRFLEFCAGKIHGERNCAQAA
jgi:hypothetical protein